MSNLYSAMYASPEEEEIELLGPDLLDSSEGSTHVLTDISQTAKTISITIEGRTIVLPNLAYLQKLEAVIDRQSKDLKKLANVVRQHKEIINRHSTDLRSMEGELNNKLDMRDN